MADWTALNQNIGDVGRTLGDYYRQEQAKKEAMQMLIQTAMIKAQIEQQAKQSDPNYQMTMLKIQDELTNRSRGNAFQESANNAYGPTSQQVVQNILPSRLQPRAFEPNIFRQLPQKYQQSLRPIMQFRSPFERAGQTLMQNKQGEWQPEKKPNQNEFIIGQKENIRQDRLEKIASDRMMKGIAARSGDLGVQNSKVSQAVHLRALADQYYDSNTGDYNIPQTQLGEILIGLANLVANTNAATEEQLRAVTPKTARGSLSKMVAYWTGTPVTANTQAMIKNIVDSVDRQGSVSEKLRNNYFKQIEKLFPKDLEGERKEAITGTILGNSFESYLKESPSRKTKSANMLTATNPKTGMKIKSLDGGNTWQPM